MVFAITGDTGDVTFGGTDEGGHTIDEVAPPNNTDNTPTDNPDNQPTDNPDTPIDTSGLSLGLAPGAKNPFGVGDEVPMLLMAELDAYPTTYRDVQVGISSKALGDNLTFDPDATADQTKAMGLTAKSPVTEDGYKAYEYTDGSKDYRIWVYDDNSLRVEWDKGTTGSQLVPLTLKAQKATGDSGVQLTPSYLGSKAANDTPVSLGDGSAATVVINGSSTTTPPTTGTKIDGSTLRLDPHSITKDQDNGTSLYRISDFPLFYMKETDDTGKDLYSFIYNHNSTGQSGSPTYSLEHLRMAVLAGTPYDAKIWGGAQATTNTEPAWFENFHQVNATKGTVIAGTEKQFEAGKTYSLIPYNPVSGTKDRFIRIQTGLKGDNYYMPDGIPTFTFDDTGHFQLNTPGDGNAKKGQWQVNGTTLEVALYKVKKIKVVDDDGGKPVPGAKLTLKNATAGDSAYMKAATGTDGTGELLPNDYDNSKKGPFYYAEGIQAFSKLDLPAGYTADVDFSMTLGSTDDKLALASGAKNAAISDDGQVLTLTVHKTKATDSQINIQKVAKEDPTKTLGGAKFNVEEVDNTNDALKTQDVTTGDSDGKAQLTVDSNSTTTKRTFHITETAAPGGYDIGNKTGYYATWTKGTGFTAVGETKGATTTTSTDKLASVKDGLLTIQDPQTPKVAASFKMKKTDQADPTQGVTGTATFTVRKVDNPAGDEFTVKTTNGEITSTPLAGLTSGMFSIQEKTAPDGYVLDNSVMYFQWSADKGVTAVGSAGESNKTPAAQSAKNLAGKTVLRVEKDTDGKGILNFSDAKKAVDNSTTIRLKKVSASDPTKGLAGAKFMFQEMDGVNQVGSATTGVTSDANGDVSFTPAASSATTRFFRVTEQTPPAGYTKGKLDSWYIGWTKGNIYAYGSGKADLKLHNEANYMNAKLDATTGVLTIQDPEQTSTITTNMVALKLTDPNTPVGDIDLTLSNPDESGTPLKVKTDSNGKATVSASQVATALGLDSAAATGTVDVRLDVSNENGEYTAPISRLVKFTFAGGKATAGWSVYGTGATTNPLQATDKFVSSDTSGNLAVTMRHDTLTVRGIKDDGTDQGMLPGAKFTMTFKVGDKAYTSAELTVPKSGVITLPDPNTLVDKRDAIGVNQDCTVVVHEVSAPDGYSPVDTTTPDLALTYTSGKGYTRFTNPKRVPENSAIPFATASQLSVGDLPSSQVTTYYKGGSDITYYLLENITDLQFSNLPANNELDLNFGVHPIQTGAQDILLSDTTNLATFEGATTPTTTLTNDPNSIGVSVTQQGQYADGWTVELQADPLTSESGSNGVDTIQGASLLFGDGQGTLTKDGATPQQQSDLLAAPDLQAALGGTTPMLKADGQTAGEYSAAWQTNQVKLHVPGGQGWPDTNYHAAMTWNLVVGGPQN